MPARGTPGGLPDYRHTASGKPVARREEAGTQQRRTWRTLHLITTIPFMPDS
jgi:hypothetical protein